MSTQFKDSDGEILIQIIEYANQRYLRESRVHNKSTFNILRILSAFKQTNHQYFNRKDQIYNWILYITKNYNPQTMKEWMSAISELLRNRKKIINDYKQKKQYYQTIANRTTNQFTYNYQSQNFQNGLNTVSEIIPSRPSINLRAHISRDISSSPSMHQGRTNDGFNTGNYNPKMHYISFQPNYDDKENIDSENKKNNAFKQDNQPTKTPIQQSFILNLPNSYGSPFVFSKITNNTINNTKEVTEAEDEEGDEEWANMKTRAIIYHMINLKMKSFSALLANFQAFESFQFLFKKYKLFQKKMYFRRLSQSYSLFVNSKSIKRRYFDKAGNFYRGRLLRKAFKILEIIVKLKIRSKKQKILDIKKYNRFNVEFILSVMFCPGGREQQDFGINDTPKSIREKSKHFMKVEDCQKMQLISQYFQCNLKATKQQISRLFELHRYIRKQKTFDILRMNIRTFSSQLELMKVTRKKVNFQIFASLMLNQMKNKRQLKISDMIKSRRIKQKCFKVLLQFNLSKKIYAKREQFLAFKHKQLILSRAIKFWKKRLQDQQTKKLGYETRVREGVLKISNQLKSKLFKEFFYAMEFKLEKQLVEQKQRAKQTLAKVFGFMKQKAFQKKKSQEIKQRMDQRRKQQAFICWNKNSKISKGLRQLVKFASKQAFLKIKEGSQTDRKYQKLVTFLEFNSFRWNLNQMRINYNKEKALELAKLGKCSDAIRRRQFHVFRSIVQFDQKIAQYQRQKDDTNKKAEAFINFMKKFTITSSLGYLKKNKELQKCFKRKQNVVESVMGNRHIQKNNQESQLSNFQTLTPCHKKLKREAILLIRSNLIFIKSNQALMQKRKQASRTYIVERLESWRGENCLQKLSGHLKENIEKKVRAKRMKILKELSLSIYQKKQKAIENHKKSLRFRTLLGLARAIMYSATLGKRLQHWINCKQKGDNAKILLLKLQKEKILRQKTKTLYKLIFMANFRKLGKTRKLIRSKVQDIGHSRKKMNLRHFVRSFDIGKVINQALVAEDLAYKKYAVYKINWAINRFIVKKKEQYMAFKFRALQICRQAFRALYSNCSQKNYELVHSKKYRILEHISTSYSSI